MHQNEAEGEELEQKARGEEPRHWVLLYAHGVQLKWHQNYVARENQEVQLHRVVPVIGKLVREEFECAVVGIAIDQPNVIIEFRVSSVMLPLARDVVPVAGH